MKDLTAAATFSCQLSFIASNSTVTDVEECQFIALFLFIHNRTSIGFTLYYTSFKSDFANFLSCQVELRCHDGTLVNAYSFIHLTVQEFLAALRIMTSHKVSDAQLKKR